MVVNLLNLVTYRSQWTILMLVVMVDSVVNIYEVRGTSRVSQRNAALLARSKVAGGGHQ